MGISCTFSKWTKRAFHSIQRKYQVKRNKFSKFTTPNVSPFYRNAIFGVFFVLFSLSDVFAGDVRYVETCVGDSADIFCTLSKNDVARGISSCNLTLKLKYNYDNVTDVPQNDIEILNETAILYRINNAPLMKADIWCECPMCEQPNGIDIGEIVVDYPPHEINDFECTSFSYEYFLCSFTPMKNKIRIDYTLTFCVNCDRGVYISKICNLTEESGRKICNITGSMYQPLHEAYNFTLKSHNTLGTRTQVFNINNHKSVKPLIYSMEPVEITDNNALIVWKLKNGYCFESRDFDYDITISDFRKESKILDHKKLKISSDGRDEFRAIIKLEYPYTMYKVSMRIKIPGARDDLWSDRMTNTFRTLSIAVEDAPETDVGSFFSRTDNDIHLFWKQLPKYKENGPNIQYIITERIGHGILGLDPWINKTDETTIKFTGSPLVDYVFVIRSENDFGESKKWSEIKVPKRRFEPPSQLKSVYKNGVYLLSWKPPKQYQDLVNYTIFWCTWKRTSSKQCQGSIDFSHISKCDNGTTHTSKTRDLHFAISANSKDSSSGMIWTACNSPFDSDFIKLQPTLTVQSATEIKINWNVECNELSIIDGYKLKYCPVQNSSDCIESEKEEKISDEKQEYMLSSLNPYTKYKISMSMFSNNRTIEGPYSDPQNETTFQEAPTPPGRLTYYNVTNSSVTLSWEAPQQMNGILSYYEIVYNNDKIKLNDNELTNKTHITFHLKNLESYKGYKLYVIATTVKDSNASNDISFRTAIGNPGRVVLSGNSQSTFTWNPPKNPRGPIDYYEFRVQSLKGDDINSTCTIRLKRLNITLKSQLCHHNLDSFKFSVRAVNIDHKQTSSVSSSDGGTENSPSSEDVNQTVDSKNFTSDMIKDLQIISEMDDEIDLFTDIYCDYEKEKSKGNSKWNTLNGNWSATSHLSCGLAADFKLVIFVAIAIVLAVGFGMTATRSIKKYRLMKSIELVLPPGLSDLEQENTFSKEIDFSGLEVASAMDEKSGYNFEKDFLLTPVGERIYAEIMPNTYKTLPGSGNGDFRNSASGGIEENSSANHDSSTIYLQQFPTPPCKMENRPIIINGYVQHRRSLNPNPSLSFGYTQMDRFEKPIKLNQNGYVTRNSSNSDGWPNRNIGGYVTQQQLNDFGSKLH